MSNKIPNIILVGLPNTGKTTLFNALTGLSLKTGNWSGVTIGTHQAKVTYMRKQYELIDAPGILSIYDDTDQMDCHLCREAIKQADKIINVVDGRFLQRDLVLSLQLRYYQKSQITVVTHVEESQISWEAISDAIPGEVLSAEQLLFGQVIEGFSQECFIDPEGMMEWPIGFRDFWEKDCTVSLVSKLQVLSQKKGSEECLDVLIAEGFYQTAAILVDRAGARKRQEGAPQSLDRLAMHPTWGLPIFIGVMYLVFALTIGLGGATGEFVSGILTLCLRLLPNDTFLFALLDAVGQGLATGIGFIPVLYVMYLLLSILEQSGYLARVVLLTDGLMRAMGLSGHAFIPMLLGFGCNVPAILSIRTISGRGQRLLTAIMMPFMSCSARLSIFVVFAATFFPFQGAVVVMALYLLGITLGLLTVKILSYILNETEEGGLAIHLPQYQRPQVDMVFKSVHFKMQGFIQRTLKYIVAFSSIFALLSSIDIGLNIVAVDQSVLAILSQKVAGGFGFMGIYEDNWPAVAALFSGLVAKEIVLTTLSTLYQMGDVVSSVGIQDFLVLGETFLLNIVTVPLQIFMVNMQSDTSYSLFHQYFSQASALAYMVFILLYFPCLSTLIVLKNEFGGFIASMSFLWSTMLAVWLSKLVYSGAGGGDICMLLICFGVVVGVRRRYDANLA